MRVDSRRPLAYALVAAAAVLPRLAVLLHERGTITAAYVDKGDVFARTLIAHGTYGFIPGRPSAYTQPLYGWFLVPLYWIFTRSWVVVGLAQIAVAAATALLVYEIGRRWISPLAGLLGALAATLHPYLVWHDVHMNREILDELLAAAILACAVVVAPWVVRNRVSVGCTTLTTDGRALWKANNPNTLRTLEHGKWIDDVPPIPGAPPSPQDAGAIYAGTGRVVRTDECAQMRYYRHLAFRFMRRHPGEKAKLAGVAARRLWQPAVTRPEGRRGARTSLDFGRRVVEPTYMIVLYALGLVGLLYPPRRLAAFAVALLAYDTLTAMLFAGETRYRVPWDFLIALCAAGAVTRLARRRARSAADEPARPAPERDTRVGLRALRAARARASAPSAGRA